MRAAVFHEPGKIVVTEVPVPRIEADEILLRVRAASICGTDLRISRHGHFKLPPGRPRILGHEVAGEVVEVGSRVSGHAVGDRVSLTPNVGCGRCSHCRAGLNNMCPDYEAFGITLDGGFQEYLRVPGLALQRGNVFRLPETLSYTEAALVEPFSCCYRGQRAVGVGYEDVVVIIGAGPIGAFHVMLARLAGAEKIIVSGHGGRRLEAAGRLGADVVVEVPRQDLAEVVAEQTGGRGADVVITAASSPQVQSEAVGLLATHGRLNFFAGLGRDGTVPLDVNALHYKGLTLTGTTGSSNADYARSLRLAGERRVRLDQLVTAAFPIERIDEAFEHAASGAGMKAMVVFDGDKEVLP
ncbi:zinc-dependent dehydrogenase [Nonomuraea muscovyensis]|uniref:Threonine dehydrogenase-like Zn-dependent dehydrogenase n=1 Tax=Nonomuraea muscovyensis TaxID=1124761 RepID=A0A7X0BWE2_9ACTN|nr:zinc-dependent dehydrogenase [Nonomuraea muscovyensis]MBB6343823.1 threonine dehydrogenase-like Zn-dependent dehydrogenase [Nonomuraea muscovyensis]